VTTLLLPFLAALTVTLALTPAVRAFARTMGLVAAPRQDRWHDKSTALMGGMAVYAGFLAGAAAALWTTSNASTTGPGFIRGVGVVLASTLMFLAGLADDKLKLRPATKLIFQAVAAAIVISFGVIYPATPWTTVNVLVTVFWFIALTNALNLLDNMDGVAVGVAGIAAVFLAVTFVWEGQWTLGSMCLALAGAAFGFLPYNFSRASIFMGDSGSLFIGALLAGLGAAYPSTAPASIVSVLFVPALIVIIPIADTLLVTVARTFAGRSISVGGRDHTSHRLVAMGLSERQVALLLYGFAASGGVLALLLRGASTEVGVSVGAVFLVALVICAAYLGRMHTYPATSKPSGRVTLLISDILYKRRALEVVLDIVLFAVAYQGAYLLRWDGNPPPDQSALFARTLALAVAAKLAAFGLLGVYRGVWQHLSMADAHRFIQATLLGSLLTVATLVFFFREDSFARGVFVIDGCLVALLVTGTRASFRSLDRVRHSLGQNGEPVLIYGAGMAGELVIREITSNTKLGFRPVGFVDDDPRKQGSLVHGYPVVGGIEQIRRIAKKQRVGAIILCSRQLRAENLASLPLLSQELGIRLLQLHLEFQTVSQAETAVSTAPVQQIAALVQADRADTNGGPPAHTPERGYRDRLEGVRVQRSVDVAPEM
jgi:UDP-GlcNAc:undecaprenyl-phosphate/decaprenyl-phosphate GlcNAc-1-phosphate transferase